MAKLLSTLLLFCYLRLSYASSCIIFDDIQGVEIKDLNSPLGRSYDPEWNPENDPVHEPAKTVLNFGCFSAESLEIPSNETSFFSDFCSEQTSLNGEDSPISPYYNFTLDSEQGVSSPALSPSQYMAPLVSSESTSLNGDDSPISPNYNVALDSEQFIPPLNLFYPSNCTAPLKFWYMHVGGPVAIEPFFAAVSHLDLAMDVFEELSIPTASSTYSLISHRFRNPKKIEKTINNWHVLKINRKLKGLRTALYLLGKSIEKKLKDDNVIAVILDFSKNNFATVSIIVDSSAEMKNNVNIRAQLSERFVDIFE